MHNSLDWQCYETCQILSKSLQHVLEDQKIIGSYKTERDKKIGKIVETVARLKSKTSFPNGESASFWKKV